MSQQQVVEQVEQVGAQKSWLGVYMTAIIFSIIVLYLTRLCKRGTCQGGSQCADNTTESDCTDQTDQTCTWTSTTGSSCFGAMRVVMWLVGLLGFVAFFCCCLRLRNNSCTSPFPKYLNWPSIWPSGFWPNPEKGNFFQPKCNNKAGGWRVTDPVNGCKTCLVIFCFLCIAVALHAGTGGTLRSLAAT